MLSSVTPRMHALLFVSMGVEARCHPSKSTAHCRHMKRQPFLCNGCPHHGHRHCHHHRHLHCCCQLRCHCRPRCNCPLPITVTVAVSHCRCGCHRPLQPPSLLRCRQPSLLPLPLPLAIAVSVTVDHHSCHRHWPSPTPCCQPFLRVVALVRQKMYSTN